MVNYSLSIEHANQQYIQFQVRFDTNNDTTIVRLPSWRPGRYELGNFAKNVKGFKVYNDQNKRIDATKITKDAWQVDTTSTQFIRVQYAYFSMDLNAGSTFLSKDQLYVNPVNCFVFTDEQKAVLDDKKGGRRKSRRRRSRRFRRSRK